VFLTPEPLVKEPTQKEIEKAIGNLKTHKVPGEDDIIVGLIKNASQELTHLCLTFHYWKNCDGVIYILLLKVIAESDFFHTFLPPEGTCYHVVHRVSHCCRSCRAESLLKK
jgi:hypothetical protein